MKWLTLLFISQNLTLHIHMLLVPGLWPKSSCSKTSMSRPFCPGPSPFIVSGTSLAELGVNVKIYSSLSMYLVLLLLICWWVEQHKLGWDIRRIAGKIVQVCPKEDHRLSQKGHRSNSNNIQTNIKFNVLLPYICITM